MESRFATPSDGVTIRYAIGWTPRASGEPRGDRFVHPFPAVIGYDSLKQGLIGLGTSSCKTELTRQIADSGAAPTKEVTIRYPRDRRR